MSLMDGTVFEIVKELEEIQQLNERSLFNKRVKVRVFSLFEWVCTLAIIESLRVKDVM